MNYAIDLDVTHGGIPKIVKLSQYDKTIPNIVVTLWNGSTGFLMPANATCYVAGTKPDKTGFQYEVSNTNNVVTIPVTEQMTACAGRVPTEVFVQTSDGRKGSANFFLDVEPAALSEDTIISETDIPVIEELAELVDTFDEKIAEAGQMAELSHKWATYGSDSETPSATNNAKYWANQAAQTDIGELVKYDTSTDKTPYLFRQSTHSAEYDKLVGLSVVKNQLVDSGTSSVTIPSGRKYALYHSNAWSVGQSSGSAISVTGGSDMFIDLTLKFGSSVADKIYTMEQATAGSGIAYLKSLGLLKDGYEAYNVGEIVSSQPVKRVVRGFNQWDEEITDGELNADGSVYVTTSSVCSKNYCKCLPNTDYYFKNVTNVVFYDEDKNAISRTATNNTITRSPQNAYYFKIDWRSSATYSHTTCINISDTDKNGTYEPYTEVEYDLGSDTLRGIPTLDGNNIVADGDVKTSDGVINTRYLEPINLGDLTWLASSLSSGLSGGFVATLSGVKAASSADSVVRIVCSKYVAITRNNVYRSEQVGIAVGTDGKLYVYDTAYSDSATFKTAMDGVYLLAEKATPTTEVSTPFTSPQVSMVTEEIVSDVPCGHDSTVVDISDYYKNEFWRDILANATKVDGIERALPSKVEESNIAPVENGSTASTSYSVGRLIMRNGVLYKVSSPIASGGTFTVGTNITKTTLDEVIASL